MPKKVLPIGIVLSRMIGQFVLPILVLGVLGIEDRQLIHPLPVDLVILVVQERVRVLSTLAIGIMMLRRSSIMLILLPLLLTMESRTWLRRCSRKMRRSSMMLWACVRVLSGAHSILADGEWICGIALSVTLRQRSTIDPMSASGSFEVARLRLLLRRAHSRVTHQGTAHGRRDLSGSAREVVRSRCIKHVWFNRCLHCKELSPGGVRHRRH